LKFFYGEQVKGHNCFAIGANQRKDMVNPMEVGVSAPPAEEPENDKSKNNMVVGGLHVEVPQETVAETVTEKA
jgi:hypothetical protein